LPKQIVPNHICQAEVFFPETNSGDCSINLWPAGFAIGRIQKVSHNIKVWWINTEQYAEVDFKAWCQLQVWINE